MRCFEESIFHGIIAFHVCKARKTPLGYKAISNTDNIGPFDNHYIINIGPFNNHYTTNIEP